MSEPGEPEQGDFVIDASSLLAYLRGHAGGDLVQRVFLQCAECGYKVKTTALALLKAYEAVALENEPMLDDVISLVEQLPMEVRPLSGDAAAQSVRMSFAEGHRDSARVSVVELAASSGATLVTADKEVAAIYPRCLLVSGDPH